MKKVLINKAAKVQLTQTATDYIRSLFVQRGLETVSKALVKTPRTIKNHILC